MENIDYTQALPDGLSTMITAGGILLLSAIIVMTIVIAKRWKGRFIPMLLGIVAYIIFGFICTNLITSVIALIPGTDAVFTNSPNTYKIVYYITATIAFTVARIVCSYMYVERYERQGDIYLGGIGLGLGDCALYGITSIINLTWVTAISSTGLESVFADFAPDQVASTYESISNLFTAPTFLWLLLAISCIYDIVLNIALMNVVYGAVKGQIAKYWIGVSAAFHFVTVISFQFYEETAPSSVALWFCVKTVIFVAVVYYVFNNVSKEISYKND